MNESSDLRARVSALLTLVVLVVACGGSSSSSHASATANVNDPKLAQPATITELKVSYFGLELIASQKGYFSKYNLTVNFVNQVTLGIAGVPAIVANQAQTGQGFGFTTPIVSDAGGAKIKAVVAGLLSTDGDYRYYVRPDSGITDAKGLIGKKIAVDVGGYPDIALQIWLRKAGVPLNQVTRVTVPQNAACDALTRKQIDMVAMYSLFWVSCEKQHAADIKMLFKDNDALPSAKLYSAYVFTTDYISAHPDVVRAFVAALKDAARFVETKPAEAKSIVASLTNTDPDLILVPSYPKNNCIDMQAVGEYIKAVEDLQTIPKGSVKREDVATNQFNPGC